MSGRETSAAPIGAPPSQEPPGHLALFLAFFEIGVLGFGGVAAWARHVLVEKRRFLEARDFARSFGLASTLPGANTVNLSVMLGDRFRGTSGALAALSGLMGAPLALLIVIATLYGRYGDLADVKAALFGAAAAGAGVVLGNALKLLHDLESELPAVLVAAGVCLAALFGLPMPAILLLAVPLAIVATRRRERRA